MTKRGSAGAAKPQGAGESDAVPFVIGVDGGGTGSRALATDLRGGVLGEASGPPALVSPSVPGRAAEAVGATVRSLAHDLGLDLPAKALWTGLAGAGPKGQREAEEQALRSMGLARVVKVGMDVEGAHFDAFGQGPGFLMVVGTGSAVWGRTPDGGEVRVGGWGSLLGDEGGGYWLGLEGLRAVIRAFDKRVDPTVLSSAVLETLRLSDPTGLPAWVDRASKRDVAALAPLILQAAAQGDPMAADIVERGLQALGLYMDVLKRAWSPFEGNYPLAFVGGLVDSAGAFGAALRQMAWERGATCIQASVVPARGAAKLARELVRSS